MGTVQYHQNIQNGDTGAMDTTPILQHPNDMNTSFIPSILPSAMPTSSVVPQLMQEIPPVFPTMPDPSTILVNPMHAAISEIPSSAAFMNTMEVAPAPHMRPGPPGFLSDLSALDPFTAMDSTMGLEVASNLHSLSASVPGQTPSPSIHGTASMYSAGVTSSLESALDQPGVITRRSRANTSVSPVTLPPSYIGMSPAAVTLPFLSTETVSIKAEAESVVAVENMLEDIEQTAKHARTILHHRHDRATSSSIGLLNERISQVTQKFAGLVSISTALNSTPYSVPLQSSGILVKEPRENPLSFVQPTIPLTSSPMDVSVTDHLNISDHSRKRCASVLEEQRSVKAPKREPQDDAVPLNLGFGDTPPAVATPSFTVVSGIVLPTVPIKQPPTSRPPTPPTTFSPYGPFGSPGKPTSAGPSFSPFPTSVPSQVDFGSNSSAPMPTIPPVFHSSWSDPVVSTRHHHSLSTGSHSGAILPSTPPVAANNMADPFTTQPLQQTVTTISPPIGRMSRSGSISGTFPNSWYMEASSGSWAGRVGPKAPAQVTPPNWFDNQMPGSSLSPASDRPPLSTMPSTSNSDDDDDDDDDDDNESGLSKNSHHSSDSPAGPPSGSDVPQEYRAEVDRIFFEYLNKICSNLDATDNKGEPIHQTLMAKKMQRLSESLDFRPFKFRIQAFTNGFLDELARSGYPEDKIPMKKIRNYLWRQQYILRFNEDGKKAKSKGNHIWNIEAKKVSDGRWEFRPFHRKLAGTPPPIAYCGLKWSWTPRVWDPQAAWQNVPVEYTSPSLPSWLSWNNDMLSGIPPPDAESCFIIVNAKYVLDGQEGLLSHTFQLSVAPATAIEASAAPRSRRPSLAAGEPPRRSASDSMLFQGVQRVKPRPLPVRRGSPESPDTRVIRVLQSVVARVTEEKAAQEQYVSASPPKASDIQELAKQKQVLEHTVDAYDKAITRSGDNPQQDRLLAVAAQNVVVQAAHTVIADRTVASGGIPHQHSETTAIKSVTVNELSDATQGAIAAAVKQTGRDSTEVDIMVAATSILKARTPTVEPPPVIRPPRSHTTGTAPRILPMNPPPYPLSSVSEYV